LQRLTIKNRDIISREEEVDVKVKDARERHIKRFHKRLCRAEAGPFFVEMLIHLERISDHCNNIAEYVLDIKEKELLSKYNATERRRLSRRIADALSKPTT
jgi:Na+/phosphate symporter